MLVLDLCCGAGGSAMGIMQAWPGCTIVGVDIKPQPHFPFEFIQDDWKNFLQRFGRDFNFIWAGPVCKRYTRMTNCRPGRSSFHPDDISIMRTMLQKIYRPWVIENVPGAPLQNPIILCGQMFNLPIYRHRLFECSFLADQPKHPQHKTPASRAGHWEPGTILSIAGNFSPVSLAREAMGIPWMTRNELSQAIPPIYSKYILKYSTRHSTY